MPKGEVGMLSWWWLLKPKAGTLQCPLGKLTRKGVLLFLTATPEVGTPGS